jgi:hypothetical protein
VHHVIAFQTFGLDHYKEANAVSNLASLCHVCHSLLEGGKLALPGE